jgi:FKBP-type peptidyl-prolyl cis-trans isomerase
LKNVIVLTLAAAFVFGCAAPSGPTGATSATSAVAACTPPPKEMVVKELTPGTGREVRFRSAIVVSYTGWLYDGCKPDLKGAEFDSSTNRQTPFGFMVGAGKVIKGWDEGVMGMREKGKRLLVIPPDKGYGDQAAPGGKIPAGSTLVFEIELHQIIYQPGEPQTTPQVK